MKDKYNIKGKVNRLKNNSVYLYGEAGSGKTVLSTFILRKIWSEGKNGKFVVFPEFIYELQSGYEESLDKVNNVKCFDDCLVLDDFGAERMTDFVRQTSYIIINYREMNELQTIITSNFTLDEIDANIDRRISSRIAGMCEIIKLEGDKRINV